MRITIIYMPLLKFMSPDSDCQELEFLPASASWELPEVAEKPSLEAPPAPAPPALAALALRLFENSPARLQPEPHLW
jgi:hypothetical protein